MRFVLAALFLFCDGAFALKEAARPKLVLVIVFDQFRADALTRFKGRFLPPKMKDGRLGGFRYLMENGAYYPHAQHGVLQNMTCPGHAAILSGAYPYQHGIPVNDWQDPETKKIMYCVQDDNVKTVGAIPKEEFVGTSPKNLVGSTFGDELKNAGYKSKVVAVALKDRAAILLGGHRADLAMWFDTSAFKWVSSEFYLPKGQLPPWMDQLNAKIAGEKGKKIRWTPEGPGTGYTTPSVFKSTEKFVSAMKSEFPHETTIGTDVSIFFPYGGDKTVEAAEQVFTAYKLGRDNDTDVLAVSFSAHDFIGHLFGPNSRESEEITVTEDKNVSDLLNYVNKNTIGGLKNVLVVLTADHGVGPNPEWLKSVGQDAGRIDEKELLADVNGFLGQKFKLDKNSGWVQRVMELNFYLDREAIAKAKQDLAVVERAIADYLLESKKWNEKIAHTFTEKDVRNRTLPPAVHETQILRTYYRGRSGEVIAIPKPYYVIGHSAATHLTGYSYDRSVPIVLVGNAIKPGIYAKAAQVIDIAPTLSFLSGVIAPSGSDGRILDEILK